MQRKSFYALLVGLALARPSFASTDQWIEVRSPHFAVATDAGEQQGRLIAGQFERMRWLFRQLFTNIANDPAQPIVVVATKNDSTFNSMEPSSYRRWGQLKLDGYFLQAEAKNYILLRLNAQADHPFATVYHEYTHVQFSGVAERMPLWLNEGTAEFMENTDFREKDIRTGQPGTGDILYLRDNKLVPLDVLFKVDTRSAYYHQEHRGSIFYAESWALTHYLLIGDFENHQHRWNDYMIAISRGEDPVTAAEEIFGDLKQLQKTLESYIHSEKYNMVVLHAAAATVDESAFETTPVAQSEADALRADLQINVERYDDARKLLNSALKLDPENEHAQLTMGFLELRSRKLDEARKWFSRSVSLDSRDYLARYFLAVASFMNSDAGGDRDIESGLRTVIGLNPRFAPAYANLGAYLAIRREKLDDARQLVATAIQMDPGEFSYRFNMAKILVAQSRFADAENVLHIAINLAEVPDEIAVAQKELDSIEQIRNAHDGTTEPKSGSSLAQIVEGEFVEAPPKLRYPTISADGPLLSATGAIRGVACSPPAAIEFRIEMIDGHVIRLYNNDYFKVELSALGFKPKGPIDPCRQFEGRTAQVQYVNSSDTAVDGQVMAVELMK